MQLTRNGKKAMVTSVSEFVLAQPCVSFAVSDTSAKIVDPSNMNAANLTTGIYPSSRAIAAFITDNNFKLVFR